MIIWHLITVENPLLLFCPGLFLVALMIAFTFPKLTIGVKFASLHPLNIFVLLNRRFNYINNYWLDFIISWCSKLLKEQINFFLKPGHDLIVNKQSPVVLSLYYSTLFLIVIIVCETCSSLTGKSQLSWQGKWEWLVVCNKGWESELLHFSLGDNASFHSGLDQCIYLSIPHLPFSSSRPLKGRGGLFLSQVLPTLKSLFPFVVRYLG